MGGSGGHPAQLAGLFRVRRPRHHSSGHGNRHRARSPGWRLPGSDRHEILLDPHKRSFRQMPGSRADTCTRCTLTCDPRKVGTPYGMGQKDYFCIPQLADRFTNARLSSNIRLPSRRLTSVVLLLQSGTSCGRYCVAHVKTGRDGYSLEYFAGHNPFVTTRRYVQSNLATARQPARARMSQNRAQCDRSQLCG
jgi:hypothetical protein